MSIEGLKRGDRAALAALLERHGGAVERLAEHLGAAGEERLIGAAVAIWQGSLIADPTVDERAFVLTAAASALESPADASAVYAEIDPAQVASLACRVALDLGDTLDEELLRARCEIPEAKEIVERVRDALTAAKDVAGGGAFAARWARIEPRLR